MTPSRLYWIIPLSAIGGAASWSAFWAWFTGTRILESDVCGWIGIGFAMAAMVTVWPIAIPVLLVGMLIGVWHGRRFLKERRHA